MPTENDDATRPIAAILQRLKGNLTNELSLALQNLTADVQSTGKAGKLQLTIEVEPVKGSDKEVTVAASVKVAAPKRPLPRQLFYVDDSHNLRDEDPRQMTIPGIVQAVPDPRPAPVTVPATPPVNVPPAPAINVPPAFVAGTGTEGAQA